MPVRRGADGKLLTVRALRRVSKRWRLAVVSSHPVQYYGPLLRRLALDIDLHVFFAHRATADDQARAGFGTAFEWDVDLTSGYAHTFPGNVARRAGTDRFSGCDTPEIGALLREGRFDAVLLMGWHLKSYVQGLVAAKRLGLPVMVRGDSHLETPRSVLKRAAKSVAYPPFLRLFDAALYVGRQARSYYEHYRFPEARLHFSPHCVDTGWFAARSTREARQRLRAQLGLAPATPVVLFAGKLMAMKRPLDAVEAAARLRQQGMGVEIMIAGDGALRPTIETAAATANVPVHMLGFCNQSAMPAVYAAADVLVLPSDGRETWGLVANEALACGRPIIVSSACGCAADLAVDGDVGRMFGVGDIAALAAAVAAALDRPPAPGAIGALSARYSVSAAAQGVLVALDQVGRRRGMRSCDTA